MITATYSPEDNKIRLYASTKLDSETYARVRAAGFIWAPKQELFVAPAWSPEREDLAEELAGELEDEDRSLVDRAEERADRFETYSDKRAADAQAAKERVDTIANGIPMGQPILVGHHSEKRARKDAERIQDGMRAAVKCWRTSEYWARRAKGAIAAAKYKERPDVRSRRIKTLEADQRKHARAKEQSEKFLKVWRREGLTKEQAIAVANFDHITVRFTRDKYPTSHYEGDSSIWSGLNEGYIDAAAAAAIAIPVHEQRIARAERWIAHLENRLTYERTMLDDTGGLPSDRQKPEKGGAVKCWVRRGVWIEIQKVNRTSVSVKDNYGNGGPDFLRTVPFDKLEAVLSRAEWEAKKAEFGDVASVHDRTERPRPAPSPAREDFQAMEKSLKAGVQVVSAPQLFPTPPAIADRMIAISGVRPDELVLEPSAGTGRLLEALSRAGHTGPALAIEINASLSMRLSGVQRDVTVITDDFLDVTPTSTFDVVIMNPPFENGADIEHILHARKFLKPGGRLVALCANGPRQNARLKPIADTWTELEEGAFAFEGTNVRVAMLTIRA